MTLRKMDLINSARKSAFVRCPAQFTDSNVAAFLEDLFSKIEKDHVAIDFNPIKFVYPYGTLLSAIGIREFVHERNNKGLKTTAYGTASKNSAITYLKHFCFFHFIGINEGRKVGSGEGNSRYIPITTIKEEDLRSENDIIQENITRKSFQLARIIFGKESEIMKAEMLSYCIREVIRNVFEHSEAEECILMAQKWRNGHSEIAIADQGVGIFETISKVHQVEDAAEAIKLSLKPGISKETAPENDRDKWQNSGFGLYVISELGKQFGDFSITSNTKILHRQNSKEIIRPIPVNGTAVKLNINTEDAEYFPNILHQIVEKGESLAKELPGARKSASKTSKITTSR
ncbi:hypothetical protein [Marinobacter sp. DUT-1]|uniref:hypothetical protein n=1 Tax=Marinobacter sp. DUT-1 TaxID=3412037 RepID=UPI003D17A4B2